MSIYLDYAASTPVDPRVAQRMMACLTQPMLQGNPASLTHAYGRQSREVIEQARVQIANALGAQPANIVFTSGATESDNLALFGVAKFHKDKGNHIISSRTEHKAVLEPLKLPISSRMPPALFNPSKCVTPLRRRPSWCR
jgi:cysteine desulfurase